MFRELDTRSWGKFVARDLFGPSKLGKYHNPKTLYESDNGYEFICASVMNNGINKSMPRVNDQLPPTEVGGLFLSSVVERLKADSLPKDSVL